MTDEMSEVANRSCSSAPEGRLIEAGNGVVLHVRTIGAGHPILMIPSLGRGVDDFNAVAHLLAAEGFMSILPEPRGIGGSSGPAPTDLFDLAGDYAAVLAVLCRGPVDVVGHAFGNRVARALASLDRGAVGALALLAGGGRTELDPDIRAALMGSVSEGLKPDQERLEDLRTAFFYPGNDATVWLRGWYPAVAETQLAASARTQTARWWTAGEAPVLLVQAEKDPIAPIGNAQALRRDIGQRLTLVALKKASHAILPEQPRAVAALLSAFFSGNADSESLQQLSDHLVAGRKAQS
ncbi:MAG: alpha/beta hydrolase [Alphaproteobacteria bacterium]|nr:alpha/beta hydrolase [Alphaproteobacteria bacterium]